MFIMVLKVFFIGVLSQKGVENGFLAKTFKS
jgi:hypothetical protein